MQIRRVAIADAKQLASLLREVGWFDFFTNNSLEAGTELVKVHLARCLQDDSHSMFVAQSDDGEIVGYVSAHWLPYLFLPGPDGFISELFVRPSARSHGVGRQLLETVKAEAGARGCSRLSLINFRHRESYERGFYAKMGWQERRDAASFIYPIR
jgi:GNAT superfamily N-acetyltransferase